MSDKSSSSLKVAGSESGSDGKKSPRPKPDGAPKSKTGGPSTLKPEGAPKSKPEGAPKSKPEGAPESKPERARKPKPQEAATAKSGEASETKPEGASKSKPEDKKPKLEGGRSPRSKRPRTDSSELTAKQTPASPVNEKTQNTKPEPAKGQDITWTDIFVVSVLWTSEIAYFTTTVLKNKFVDQSFTPSETRSLNGTEPGMTIGPIILTVILTVSLGTLLMCAPKLSILKTVEAAKFWIMFGGLVFNIIGPLLGIILLLTKNAAIAGFMTWVDIGWCCTHPIRFWFIFHQKFPLSIRWSHLLVSGNLLVIGVFEYLFTVLVKEVKDSFSQAFFLVAFIIVTGSAVAWLIATLFIKRHLNPVKGDLENVREEYAQTEVIESFNRRQRIISIVLFLILMCPSVIFPVAYEVISLAHVKLIENCLNPVLGWNSYRPDLLCCLSVLIIIEVLLQFLKIIRNELIDLILIAVSHIFLIVATVGIMYILYLTKDFRRRVPETGDAIFNVNGNDDQFYYIQLGHLFPRYWRAGYLAVVKDLGDGKIPIRIATVDTGEVLLEDTVNLEPSRHLSVNGYNFLMLNGKYQIFEVEVPPLTDRFDIRYFMTNGVEECNEFNERVYKYYYPDPSTTRGVKVQGRCIPIAIAFAYADTKEELAILKLPPINESIFFEVPCLPEDDKITKNGKFCNRPRALIFKNLLKYMRTVYPEISRAELQIKSLNLPNIPRGVFNIRLNVYSTFPTPRFNPGSILQFRTIDDKLLITSMCLFGIGLGIGWVAYVHFFWIQSPVRCRMLIIFSFFAMLFAVSSLTKQYFTNINENNVFPLSIMATLCFLVHMAASVLFVFMWMVTRSGEKPQQSWRRY